MKNSFSPHFFCFSSLYFLSYFSFFLVFFGFFIFVSFLFLFLFSSFLLSSLLLSSLYLWINYWISFTLYFFCLGSKQNSVFRWALSCKESKSFFLWSEQRPQCTVSQQRKQWKNMIEPCKKWEARNTWSPYGKSCVVFRSFEVNLILTFLERKLIHLTRHARMDQFSSSSRRESNSVLSGACLSLM